MLTAPGLDGGERGRERPMVKHYGTFVVRYWALGWGGERVEIEHIQSGTRARLASLRAAEDWIAAQVAAPPRPAEDAAPPDAPPGQAPRPPSRDGPGR